MAKAVKKPFLKKAIKKILSPQAKKTVVKLPEILSISTRKLLAGSEGFEADFKRDAESIKQDDLVAFANSGGGTILAGVDEVKGKNGIQKGKVVGCDVSDRERNKIVSRANGCRPVIAVKVSVETQGRYSIFRIDIPKGGLHCTSNGTYKIRRDGQTDIIDPSAMAHIIVELERKKIVEYLRSAVRPEIEVVQSEVEEKYNDAIAEIDELRSQLDVIDGRDDYDER